MSDDFDEKQSSIETSKNTNRVMDFMIEFGIHKDYPAFVSRALVQYPQKELCQLRRCTLKALCFYHAKTIIEMEHKHKLVDALHILESLLDHSERREVNAAAMAPWEPLRRGLKYQIIIHHLESCGAQSALTMIDQYFPWTEQDLNTTTDESLKSVIQKNVKLRAKLIKISHQYENDDEKYNPVKWEKFKPWAQNVLKQLLTTCGEPVLEKVAEIRRNKKRKG